eukprot:jgi/Psemu1/324402/estExt_fgenesh1_pg.C_1430012
MEFGSSPLGCLWKDWACCARTTRRASSLLDKSNLTTDDTDPTNANATANNDAQDGDDYDFNVPFGDDDEEEEESADGRGGLAAAAAAPLDDSALQLSRDGGTPLSKTGNADALLGLSMDDASPQQQQQMQMQPPSAAAAATTKPKKRRKRRRKVVIDNHETELTNDHIRGMLKDTDDIVIPMIHPASLWDEDDTGKDYRTLVRERRARDEGTNSNTNTNTRSNKRRKKTVGFADGGAASISFSSSSSSSKGAGSHAAVPSLTRPFLEDAADRGGPALHPLLKGLWEENYWKALGKPCPYKRRSNKSDNHNDNDNDDEATADDVERVRRGAGHADDESTLASQRLDEFNEAGYGLDFDDREHEQRSVVSTGGPRKQTTGDDDVDFPATMDDDDDEEEDVDAPVPDFGEEEDDEEHLTAVAAERAGDDPLDLGMAIGDVASSSTKWHKHTIRVFSHLKKCLRDSNNNNSNADADTDADLPDTVRFRELTRNVVSRRNASSVFFEMLQLKTWDFIELEQEEAYGDIFISPGLRFGEEAPVN